MFVQSNRPLRPCDKCHYPSDPAGGVALNAKQWFCAKCWLKRGSFLPRTRL